MDPPSKAFLCNNTRRTKTSEFSEESGWTMYLKEDLSTGYEASRSLASDAASSVKKNVSENGGVSGLKTEKSYRKLRLKKWKKEGFEQDDALEDTATSPYSSSKDLYLKQEREEAMNNGKHQKPAHFRTKNRVEGNRSELGFNERDSELKKNGLCLVPLSFAFNYFG